MDNELLLFDRINVIKDTIKKGGESKVILRRKEYEEKEI